MGIPHFFENRYSYILLTMNPINFRVTDEELAHLKNYCKIKKRQQSEVIRELHRNCQSSGVLNPID